MEIRKASRLNGSTLGQRMEYHGDQTGKHVELLPSPHLLTPFPLPFPDLLTPRGGRPIFFASRGQHLLKPLYLWPDSFPHGRSRSRRAFILSTPPQSS